MFYTVKYPSAEINFDSYPYSSKETSFF